MKTTENKFVQFVIFCLGWPLGQKRRLLLLKTKPLTRVLTPCIVCVDPDYRGELIKEIDWQRGLEDEIGLV